MSPPLKIKKKKKEKFATKTRRHQDAQKTHNQYNKFCEFFESLGLLHCEPRMV